MNRSRAATLAVSALVTSFLGVGATGTATAATTSAVVATDTVGATHAQNERVPAGAVWTQHYFPSSDGSDVELHADVLLPEGLAAGRRVPVVLSIGPYFGHSGQMGSEGHERTGPSDRFADLTEGGDLFARGYALVLVDSRGFGGSTGCLDFAGPGEQADVAAAIDWAAGQPWSTGAVGMYGKSYDAITGLIGNDLDQDALEAVVAQEPIWEPYRNMHSNGVPRTASVLVATTYNGIAAGPQLPDDDPRYQANAAYEQTHPQCLVQNSLGYLTPGRDSQYWTDRDLPAQAAGTDTPLLFTQGFLEWNTEAEGMQEYLDNHAGAERGWLGPWDHVRGGDRVQDGRLAMGRDGWFEEVMAFYDEHLKGIAPSTGYPAFAVQDSTGTWRAQDAWPAAERSATLDLTGGSYRDDGRAADPATNPGSSFTTWSQPLAATTRITGTPQIALDTTGNGNVMVRLCDVAPDGTAVVFDEQVSRLRSGTTSFDFRSTDWTLPAGHVLGVEVGTVQPARDGIVDEVNDWVALPSLETVGVTGARLDLALDDPADDVATGGDRSPYLDTYLGERTADRPAEPGTFTLPPAND